MKKQLLAKTAAKLYIEKFMTLKNIAKQLNISERTLRRWKAAEDWGEQRDKYIKSKTSLHKDLYDFGRALLNSIITDMENGEKVEPSRMYAVTKIINMLKKAKSYEDNAATNTQNPEQQKPKGLTPEVIREIEEKILGITYDE